MALAEDIEGHARLVRGHIILTVLKAIGFRVKGYLGLLGCRDWSFGVKGVRSFWT